MARSNLKDVVIVDLYSYSGFKDEIINLLGEEESNKIYDNQEKPDSNFTNLLKAFKIIANKNNSLRFIFYLSMLSSVFEDSVKMLDNNGNIVLCGNQGLFYHLGVHCKFLNKIHVFSKEKCFASSSFNRYCEKYRLNIDVKTYKPHSLRKILDELSTKNLPATNNNMNPSNAIRNLEEYKALARFRMSEEPPRARIIEESKDSARNQIIEMLASQKQRGINQEPIRREPVEFSNGIDLDEDYEDSLSIKSMLNKFKTDQNYKNLTLSIMNGIKGIYRFKPNKQDITGFIMTCHKVYTQACTRFRQFHPTELASNESKNIYFIYLLKFMTINGYANSKSFSLCDAFGPNSIKEITELFSVSIDFRGVGGAYRNLSSNWNESNDNGIEHSNQIFNFCNNLFQLLIKEKCIETNNTYSQKEINKILRKCIDKTITQEMKNKDNLNRPRSDDRRSRTEDSIDEDRNNGDQILNID